LSIILFPRNRLMKVSFVQPRGKNWTPEREIFSCKWNNVSKMGSFYTHTQGRIQSLIKIVIKYWFKLFRVWNLFFKATLKNGILFLANFHRFWTYKMKKASGKIKLLLKSGLGYLRYVKLSKIIFSVGRISHYFLEAGIREGGWARVYTPGPGIVRGPEK